MAGMSSSDGLGGTQRGAGNMQRVAPGPAVVPVVQSPGPSDIQMSAPFQVIQVCIVLDVAWLFIVAVS